MLRVHGRWRCEDVKSGRRYWQFFFNFDLCNARMSLITVTKRQKTGALQDASRTRSRKRRLNHCFPENIPALQCWVCCGPHAESRRDDRGANVFCRPGGTRNPPHALHPVLKHRAIFIRRSRDTGRRGRARLLPSRDQSSGRAGIKTGRMDMLQASALPENPWLPSLPTRIAVGSAGASPYQALDSPHVPPALRGRGHRSAMSATLQRR